MPELVFPQFLVLTDARQDGDFVIVPSSYVMRLAEYKVRIAETEKNYKEIKALYENKE